MTRQTRRWIVPAMAAMLFAGTACGGGGGTVDVTLQEFAVGADPSSVGAGDVKFDVTNNGPEDEHEFVVIKTDLAPTELPVDENGAVDEEGAGIDVIGEIEPFAVGQTKSITFDLEAGSYVLICNVWDAQEQEAHYSEGMRTGFTVE
jgi:uncharacterized cupredoxin-like copper-binding protein